MKVKKFGRIVSLLILPLIAVILYSTLKAFFLNQTPSWSFEVTIFLYGAFFMLGAAYCHREKKHVAVDVLIYHVSPRSQRILKIIGECVVLFVALVMLWISAPSAYRSMIMGERSTHQTPFNPYVWWYRMVIPISCALLSWQSFWDLFGLISGRGSDLDREENEHAG
ncbi:MAG: TRAP transporter small permease [Synergistaceae bacterium]|jgi:TRAP-type mannitol/chloroaromatic compound transport system permease small subunit|nr:TRAP transporter small permease [Synergistaceae bacterium]